MLKAIGRAMMRLAVVVGLFAAASVQAASPVAKIVSRPLTAGQAGSLQKSSGLNTTGIGMPLYLEVQVTNATAAKILWTIQSKPAQSKAALTNSPLTNLTVNTTYPAINSSYPIYDIGERRTRFIPTLKTGSYLQARKVLKPDVQGTYVVVASLFKSDNSTIISATSTVVAATYEGDQQCAYCHGVAAAVNGMNDNYAGWSMTYHSDAFKRKVDGGPSFSGSLLGNGFKSSCYACHTTGYDANSAAINDGFDDVMSNLAWSATLTDKVTRVVSSGGSNLTTVVLAYTNAISGYTTVYTNVLGGTTTNSSIITNIWYSYPGAWASMPLDLQHKANIQCEDCHGPASMHDSSTTLEEKRNTISVSVSAGVCGLCHDSPTHHPLNFEWGQSLHATGTAVYAEDNSPCRGCHETVGFIGRVDNTVNWVSKGTGNEGITCIACHDPHQPTNDVNEHLVRTLKDVDLGATNYPAVYTVTEGEGGLGVLCMNCHKARQTADVYVTNTVGSSRFGPHHGPQSDMLAGKNGIEYGGFTNFMIDIPMHMYMVGDTCVGCHMNLENAAAMATSTTPAYSNSFMYAQGHTMKMTTTDGVDVVTLCQDCHGKGMTNFDFVSGMPVFKDKSHDYDGDGVVNGVQTEIRGLLTKLALMLPGGSATNDPAVDSSYTVAQLKAVYNYLFVKEDKSYGVHNSKYAVALLRASINDLTRITNYSPRTNTYNRTPTFTWPSTDGTSVGGVMTYTLTINLNGLPYQVITVKGTTSYTVPSKTPLPVGSYDWKVGSSDWVSFKRLGNTPATLTQIAPSGVSTGATLTRQFIWGADTNKVASKYNLKIILPSGKTNLVLNLTATNVTKTVVRGTNTWYVQGVGNDGAGSWGTGKQFIVPVMPAQIYPLAPDNGTAVPASSVKFSWRADTNMVASSYKIMVQTPSKQLTILAPRVTSVTKSLKTLVPGGGACSWWIYGKGPVGYGPSSKTNSFVITN